LYLMETDKMFEHNNDDDYYLLFIYTGINL
jgi:hypothetical protein